MVRRMLAKHGVERMLGPVLKTSFPRGVHVCLEPGTGGLGDGLSGYN